MIGRAFLHQVAARAVGRWIIGVVAVILSGWALPVAAQRAAGIPPVLSCPAGTVVFDWDTRAWTAGNTAASYQIEAIGPMSISSTISGGGSFVNAGLLGLSGPTPMRQTAVNGGFTGQNSLLQVFDLATRSSRVTTTITLPAIMRGAQFRLFDIDFGLLSYADLVTVEGRYNGAIATPVLTNGVTNYVVGNTAIGDGLLGALSAIGNVVVTFSQPIDTIIISVGNHTTAPVFPGQQSVALHDITMCRPTTIIATTKTSTLLSDPQNGTSRPKYVPGALVEYCILMRNTGDTNAQSVIAGDALPATLSYVPGTLRSGGTCASANTAEDDDATGADESDPHGASFSGNTITATAASLAAGAEFAVRFRVTAR